jgi:hypothetical protein
MIYDYQCELSNISKLYYNVKKVKNVLILLELYIIIIESNHSL